MFKWIGLMLLAGIIGLGAAGLWVQQWLHAHPPGVEPSSGSANSSAIASRLITIKRGTTTKRISEQLADAGLLEHPQLWATAARLLEQSQKFRAGEYAFTGAESPRDLMQRLVEGEVTSYQVSLVEGWTLQQALEILKQTPKLTWDLEGADSASLFGLLQQRLDPSLFARLRQARVFVDIVPAQGLPEAEGWLFPDTYAYTAGSAASDLVARAWQQMQVQLAAAWDAKTGELPYANPAELLTMASIVEKETGQAADRNVISQVFVRRLQIGMRLQTDPTVIYGLGSAFDGDLKRIHLRTDTPYNSYTRHGLPPTAIALPGSAALAAAANPAAGEYLYFVARGDGSSQFSKTLAEHEAAVRRYQLGAKAAR